MTKQLTRSTDDRWLSGVCGGIGQYTGVDPNLVRLAVVVLTILGVGTVIVAYVIAWALMPQQPPTPPTAGHVPPPPSP